MSAFITPLRYPGGKGRLGPWLGELMRHNKISGGWYVEPYAGGAGAAFYLLMNGYVNHIVINDADPIIYAFWSSVLNNNHEFIQLVNDTPITMDTWYKQREIISSHGEYSELEVGFATFFLNRTNRSGILSGGVIGGKDQTGPYKINARYNKEKLSARIKKIGDLKKHVSLYNVDALVLLDIMKDVLPKESLIYLDPPYYQKGSQLYRNHYKPDDHAKIAKRIKKVNYPYLVTYDNCDEIKKLYASENSIEFSLHYSTHITRPKVTEIMIYNNLELHKPPQMNKDK